MLIIYDLMECDGKELKPGVTLIGTPSYNEEAKEWRCLANVDGMLCVVALTLTTKESP